MLAKHAVQQVSKRIVRIDCKGLLQRILRVVNAIVLIEQLRLTTPGLGVGRMLGRHLIHEPQGGLVLPFLILAKGLVDLHVNRLTAPLEFFAAAARARGVEVDRHSFLLVLRRKADSFHKTQNSKSALRREPVKLFRITILFCPQAQSSCLS